MRQSPFLPPLEKGYKQIWVPGSRGRKGYFRTQRGAKKEQAIPSLARGPTRSEDAARKNGLRLTGRRISQEEKQPQGIVNHTWEPGPATIAAPDPAPVLYKEVKKERGGSPVNDQEGVEIAREALRLSPDRQRAKEKLMEDLDSRDRSMRKSLFDGDSIEEYALGGNGVLEKAKRIWVPPSGRKKGYWRSDPRGKSRRQVGKERAASKEKKKEGEYTASSLIQAAKASMGSRFPKGLGEEKIRAAAEKTASKYQMMGFSESAAKFDLINGLNFMQNRARN